MARYTGPRVRVSRRIGFNVFENRKGDKALKIDHILLEKMEESVQEKLITAPN